MAKDETRDELHELDFHDDITKYIVSIGYAEGEEYKVA